MKKKILATVALMLTVVTLCFALSTRERLEISSEGYSWGYSNTKDYPSWRIPRYYKEDSEKKDAWMTGADRGQRDKKNGRDYDDPYMKQLQTSCYD